MTALWLSKAFNTTGIDMFRKTDTIANVFHRSSINSINNFQSTKNFLTFLTLSLMPLSASLYPLGLICPIQIGLICPRAMC
jgi:hypothetical protein